MKKILYPPKTKLLSKFKAKGFNFVIVEAEDDKQIYFCQYSGKCNPDYVYKFIPVVGFLKVYPNYSNKYDII